MNIIEKNNSLDEIEKILTKIELKEKEKYSSIEKDKLIYEKEIIHNKRYKYETGLVLKQVIAKYVKEVKDKDFLKIMNILGIERDKFSIYFED